MAVASKEENGCSSHKSKNVMFLSVPCSVSVTLYYNHLNNQIILYSVAGNVYFEITYNCRQQHLTNTVCPSIYDVIKGTFSEYP
jgi:hypothetical protein